MKRFWPLLLLFAFDYALAIDVPCKETLEEEVEAAEVIVLASIEEDSLNSEGVGEIKFKVKAQWKGEALEYLPITVNAKFPFSESESGFYLIYANRFNNENKSYWGVPWCKQVQHMEYSELDFRLLKKPEYWNGKKNI